MLLSNFLASAGIGPDDVPVCLLFLFSWTAVIVLLIRADAVENKTLSLSLVLKQPVGEWVIDVLKLECFQIGGKSIVRLFVLQQSKTCLRDA